MTPFTISPRLGCSGLLARSPADRSAAVANLTLSVKTANLLEHGFHIPIIVPAANRIVQGASTEGKHGVEMAFESNAREQAIDPQERRTVSLVRMCLVRFDAVAEFDWHNDQGAAVAFGHHMEISIRHRQHGRSNRRQRPGNLSPRY